MNGFVISSTHSGGGKTTMTLALMQALKRQGVLFSPFKTGPDYIDPMWHKAVAGKTSYNLEPHMMSPEHIRHLLERADGMPVVEGVGGLYCSGGRADTAKLAMELSLSVVFVVDAGGMAGSIAPLMQGFSRYNPKLEFAGVIANKVGSERHALMLKAALEEHDLPPLLGWLMRDDACRLPERHLGLHMPNESDVPDFSGALHLEDIFWQWLQQKRDHAGRALAVKPGAALRLEGRRIAIARDAAFCFIYPANIEWIVAQGGEPLSFSPLAGEPVPEGSDALWLPGGYPELHAGVIAERKLDSVCDFIESGKPVFAECGGMIVLGESLTDKDGKIWPMAGLLPFRTVMQQRLASLGYRQGGGAGFEPLRGHEFHYSTREMSEEFPPAFDVENGDSGLMYKQLRASYCHWYFESSPEYAAHILGGRG